MALAAPTEPPGRRLNGLDLLLALAQASLVTAVVGPLALAGGPALREAGAPSAAPAALAGLQALLTTLAVSALAGALWRTRSARAPRAGLEPSDRPVVFAVAAGAGLGLGGLAGLALAGDLAALAGAGLGGLAAGALAGRRLWPERPDRLWIGAAAFVVGSWLGALLGMVAAGAVFSVVVLVVPDEGWVAAASLSACLLGYAAGVAGGAVGADHLVRDPRRGRPTRRRRRAGAPRGATAPLP